jgi:hypothetical protein
MGTGILTKLNRSGSITPLIVWIDRMKKRFTTIFRNPLVIHYDGGVLRSVSHLSDKQKHLLGAAHSYQARSEIALDVASHYPGGDYFEFGSQGLATFRSFLGAFDIHSAHTRAFPETRFYAFDIFGNPDQGRGAPPKDRDYFEHWRIAPEQAMPLASLEPYGALRHRCIMVSGYFEDTLNEQLKAKMRSANQRIGFAFLDCNFASSYKVVFDFLIDVIGPTKMFIYLDEYFMEPSVPVLYSMFTDMARERYGLHSIYMRNAANFGALFCLMPTPAADDYLFNPVEKSDLVALFPAPSRSSPL